MHADVDHKIRDMLDSAMVNTPPTELNPAVARAINLLVRRGYEATTVDDLADVAGVSRSTFFRKYGSKEDTVFADHEYILSRVADYLSRSRSDPLVAVAEAAAMVLDHHLQDRETSLSRYQLLQQVPALRDRELVTSYRYEGAFREHLQRELPQSDRRDFGAVAVAASMVAVHNAFLRQWLRSPDMVPALELKSRLMNELTALAETFRPAFYGAASRSDVLPSVVVAVFEEGADKQAVLDAVSRALH